MSSKSSGKKFQTPTETVAVQNAIRSYNELITQNIAEIEEKKNKIKECEATIEDGKHVIQELTKVNKTLTSELESLGHKPKGGRRKSRRHRSDNNKTKRKYK